MRYDKEHKQKTRDRVLKAAADAIRRDGVEQIGVSAVMADAGLTHGGFYAHFGSKEELVSAAIEQMFVDGADILERATEGGASREGGEAYLSFYLSPSHRDTRTGGCPLPFLAGDASRLTDAARERYGAGAHRLMDRMVETMAAADSDDAAVMVAAMVGAVVLSRADPDEERSTELLERVHRALSKRLPKSQA